MQRINVYWILLPLVIALSGCALPGSRTSVSEISNTAPDRYYPVPRHLRYSFTLQNTSAATLNKAEFWVYVPVRRTSTQRVAKLSASHAYQLVVDQLGNQILHFEFENFPPLASKVIDIQADLFMADTPNPASGGDSRHFLAPERYVEADAPEITALAKTLHTTTPIATSKAAYDWVASNLKAETYIPDDRGALYALHNKTGDCTEFMDLFVALSRANGIPARGLGGYVLRENAIVKPADYHNWAEFYLDGAWRLVDAQKSVFMQRPSQYVAMRIISASVENPLGTSHRFHYSGAGLKVSMN